MLFACFEVNLEPLPAALYSIAANVIYDNQWIGRRDLIAFSRLTMHGEACCFIYTAQLL